MKKLQGFTIIDLLIGLTLGLIVTASAGALFVSTLRANLDNMKLQRMEQSIQVIKSTMAAGIRRAGFSNSTTPLPDVTGWPTGTHFYTNGTCALFTYFDTTLATPKQQFFGYKLDSTTGVLYSYQADNKVECATTTTWEPLNNPAQIKFSEQSAGTLFTSPTNPKLVEIHFIAESMELSTEGSHVRRDVLVKVFIRNS